MRKNVFTVPNTRTQRVLARLDACPAGRAHVGSKTLHEAWNTSRSAHYMRWLLERLHDFRVLELDWTRYYDLRPSQLRSIYTLPSLAEIERAVPRVKREGNTVLVPNPYANRYLGDEAYYASGWRDAA